MIYCRPDGAYAIVGFEKDGTQTNELGDGWGISNPAILLLRRTDYYHSL